MSNPTDEVIMTMNGRLTPINELSEDEAKEILRDIVRQNREMREVMVSAFMNLLDGQMDGQPDPQSIMMPESNQVH